MIPVPRIAPALKPALAVLALAGALGACSPQFGNEATTGALVGGASGAAIGGATTGSTDGALVGGALGAAGGAVVGRGLADGRDRVACEYDPLYRRDVCYRY